MHGDIVPSWSSLVPRLSMGGWRREKKREPGYEANHGGADAVHEGADVIYRAKWRYQGRIQGGGGGGPGDPPPPPPNSTAIINVDLFGFHSGLEDRET